MKTAKQYAEFFIASDNKEDALLTIGCEFIRELQKQIMELEEESMTPGDPKPNIVLIIDAQDQKWREMATITNGKIHKDGFRFVLARVLTRVFDGWGVNLRLWKLNKKLCA